MPMNYLPFVSYSINQDYTSEIYLSYATRDYFILSERKIYSLLLPVKDNFVSTARSFKVLILPSADPGQLWQVRLPSQSVQIKLNAPPCYC